MVQSGYMIQKIFDRIDHLNVHSDKDFTCIVFSDTIVVYGTEIWNHAPNQGMMWLIEFSKDLFYNLISLDIHIRAYITFGEFNHLKLKHIEAYFGSALINCYEKEKTIKCTGVFLDSRLNPYSDIFHTTKYDGDCHFVHVMQDLDEISFDYKDYPLDGRNLEATGMEWWTAYVLHYMENVHFKSTDKNLSVSVREKYKNAWRMISTKHSGLCQRLIEADFKFEKVIVLDWAEKLNRIGTDQGAFE